MNYTSWPQGGRSITDQEIINALLFLYILVLFLCILGLFYSQYSLSKEQYSLSKKLHSVSKKLQEHSERWARVDESSSTLRLQEVFQSYDKWPLAVSAAVDDKIIMQATTTPKKFFQGGTMVGLNPYLSQHQHSLALKTILLVRQLPVHEVALEILGFLTSAAVEKIFMPAVQ